MAGVEFGVLVLVGGGCLVLEQKGVDGGGCWVGKRGARVSMGEKCVYDILLICLVVWVAMQLRGHVVWVCG